MATNMSGKDRCQWVKDLKKFKNYVSTKVKKCKVNMRYILCKLQVCVVYFALAR